MTDRYSKQIIFPALGEKGQRKLSESHVVIVGCGGLGSMIATSLVRAGVGRVRVIDRDFIEYHNLHRQILFDEDDIRNELPKAAAAERHLRKINSSVEIEGVVADVNHGDIEELVSGADLIMDGLDNFEGRLLINDVSMKHGIPWVYGAALASSGMTTSFIPGKTPCFRCLSTNAPAAGLVGTCDTAGILGPVPFIIGSLQAAQAMKLLTGKVDKEQHLTVIDIWQGIFQRFKTGYRKGCPACQGKYEYLEGKSRVATTSLFGENAVQVLNTSGSEVNIKEMALQLAQTTEVTYNEFMLRFQADEEREMVVFADGRALVRNTNDESLAKALYAKYVGM
ncbi:MAG TPA: thiazole biosynthesis adenylyltransferase ThiF [Dehalococcoidia bacterium]|nr:thiazole biosynthesis adenylyltransferase ThiF [Dehalococcoidia bacterium]